MGLLVFSIVVSGGLFVCLGVGKTDRQRYGWRMRKRQAFALCGMLLCLLGTFTRVSENSVGIVYSAFDGTQEQVLTEGYNGKGLFDKVYEISTEVQTTTVEDMTTQTRDSQYLKTDIDIKYRVSADNAFMVFKQYRTLENMKDSLIVPTTQRLLEKITTKYDVYDALGEGKTLIYNELEASLPEEFTKYGVEFCSITLVDMDAGEKIETAIEEEGVAKKAVETAKYELEQTEIEAQQKAVQAQADQDAAVIEAETKIIKAQAEKESNELLQQSLTEEILRQLWIEKWNGKTPTYYGGTGTDLIFDAGSGAGNE